MPARHRYSPDCRICHRRDDICFCRRSEALLNFGQVIINALYRLWGRRQRFRGAVGRTTELDNALLLCGGVLSRIFTISEVIRRLDRFRRRGERLRRAVGRTA
ncbi:hypothetical protein D3C81_1220490 [compost metagenome]